MQTRPFEYLTSLDYIIPAFNCERFVYETIRSIVTQETKLGNLSVDISIIVVDDGSSDRTSSEIERARRDFSLSIHHIRQKNGGESSAINTGVRASGSEFICILSCDDLVDRDHAVKILSAMQKSPSAVVGYPDWKTIDADSRVLRRCKTAEFSLDRLVNQFLCLPGPGGIIRRSALGSGVTLRSQDFRFIDDYAQWLALAQQGTFIRVPHFLASWRSHEVQATSKANMDKIVSEMLRVPDWIEKSGKWTNLRFDRNRMVGHAIFYSYLKVIQFGLNELLTEDFNNIPFLLTMSDKWRLFIKDPLAYAKFVALRIRTRAQLS